MKGDALVLAADSERRTQWVQLLASRGLSPLSSDSPGKAQWLIEEHEPPLVLLDWSPKPDRFGTSTRELLATLARAHRDSITVVCDNAVVDPVVAGAIHQAHPLALTHDARLGDGSLGARIDRLLGRSVGDLRLDSGAVFHERTGDHFLHQIAARLLIAHPGSIEVARTDSDRMAVHRFRRWLAKRDSCVQVVAKRGVHCYQLVVPARMPNLNTSVVHNEVSA